VLVISKEYLDRNKLFFYKRFAPNLPIFLISKNLAEHLDLPNTGIFYSKDVASVENSQHTVQSDPDLPKRQNLC
jgi:hypothetical protein